MKYIFFLFIIILFLYSCKSDKIEYKPIGYFHSEYTMKTGAPRQGVLEPETKGQIILYEKYVAGLDVIDDFEYIWVLYHFNKAKGWDAIVRPPGSHHAFGVFATRSPRRPNPIGLSLIKIDSINRNILYVSGVDIFDNTPLLDIKPFLPSVDYVYSKKNKDAEIFLGHHDEDFINDSLVKVFVTGENK
ncbi:MAG TPA: tRNA (N6-threonylcarbamoyladenosine(37)-N6)-methyltransferase TrmO [Bacteroidetes bacterium]|nr:tRNA (N6-threonylcarbamoyladenosine(37)-N6)-methyltransferase TrmO [Bacteroidota bacterium]